MPKSQFSKEYKRFCRLMAEERKAAGMSQQELADALEKPQSYVSKYETGERRVDIIEYIEISRAIGFDSVKVLRILNK